MLGSGAVVVIDDSMCIVKAALITHEFFHHESCGKCTPCREGLDWIVKVMRRIEHGQGKEETLSYCRNCVWIYSAGHSAPW